MCFMCVLFCYLKKVKHSTISPPSCSRQQLRGRTLSVTAVSMLPENDLNNLCGWLIGFFGLVVTKKYRQESYSRVMAVDVKQEVSSLNILQGSCLILLSNIIYIGNNYIVSWTGLNATEVAFVRGSFQIVLFGAIIYRNKITDSDEARLLGTYK